MSIISAEILLDKHVLSKKNVSSKGDQQIFRRAFLQSASILFVIVCGACAVLAYHILEPFLSSILWSILAGAFLFPLKTRCTTLSDRYLRQLETDSHLLVSGLIIRLPIKIVDNIIESLSPLCIRKWKELISLVIFLPTIEFLQSDVVYRYCVTIGYDYFVLFERHIQFFDSSWIQWGILVYFFAVFTIYNRSLKWKHFLQIFAIPIWFALFLHLSQIVAIHQRFIVVTLIVALAMVTWVVERNVNRIDRSEINAIQRVRTYFRRKSVSTPLPSSSSTRYFKFVLWSLLAIKIYDFSWYLIPISIFVIIYKLIKCSLVYTYTYFNAQPRVKFLIQRTINFCISRRDALIPTPLHLAIRCVIKGDQKLNYGLQKSIDYLVSAFVIVALCLGILFGTVFLLIQIQHESIHMIKLTSNFLNQTIVLQQILPDQEYISRLMDTNFEKFYVFGRNWISTQVAKVQPPRVEPQCCLPLSVNPSESAYMQINMLGQGSLSNKNLEEQVLQLWESFYTYITNTSTLFLSPRNRSRIFNSAVNRNVFFPDPVTYYQTNADFHLKDLYRLMQDNLDLLRTVFDSIWANTTILVTLISTIISLVFTSGFALFNFVVSFIVFITLLFYLLSNSNQTTYRPTEWLNNILAIGSSSLGKAVNDVVTSVFLASLKIAAFYGLYTYVLHTMLGSNLVFLPVVIASICAMTLKSYWAALPSCLDLWLVQQRPLSALILLLAQIAPVYVVDTAIYSEVKGGGHQYLTALAIAGGVYHRGIEGALIGPMVLCCLLVGIRMYNETIASAVLSNPEPSLVTSGKERFSRSGSVQPALASKKTS